MKTKETITIPKEWLETLSRLAIQARKDQNKWHASDKPFYPISMAKLIGHASSGETILVLKEQADKRKKDNAIDREVNRKKYQKSKKRKVCTVLFGSPNKQILIDYLKEKKVLPKSEFKIENYIMLNIVCGICGKQLKYYEYDELPDESIKCDCFTDEKPVWLIKYGTKDENER